MPSRRPRWSKRSVFQVREVVTSDTQPIQLLLLHTRLPMPVLSSVRLAPGMPTLSMASYPSLSEMRLSISSTVSWSRKAFQVSSSSKSV